MGNNRFMPFGRVQVTGADAGVSLQYYHGLTKANLRNLERNTEWPFDEPPLTMREGDLYSITYYPDSLSAYGKAHLIIFLKSGWQIDLFEDGFGFLHGTRSLEEWLSPAPHHQLPPVPIDSMPFMGFGALAQKNDSLVGFLLVHQPFLGIVDSVAAALERGEEVRLRPYSTVQGEMLRRWQHTKRWFWNDLSVGAAALNYSRE